MMAAEAARMAQTVARCTKLGIRRVTKRFGTVVAVDDVSIEVSDGEFLTLLGPSGSGKTTLLTLIVGLATPDAGEIWIDGKLSTYAPPYHRDIGMVFQNYALFPHLSVFENIAFPLRMRRTDMATIRTEVARVLDIVELPHVADRLPRQLSGGQQQRIALARCMVYRPSVIVMDEPLGALDKRLRDSMQIEIKRLHAQFGTTIVYVTHDQEEALALSDRICLMRDGRIEQLATPHDLYFAPRTVFAANFVGDSNLFNAEVTAARPGRASLDGPGGIRFAAPVGAAQLNPGDRRIALVRPENLRLSTGEETQENVLRGTVESVLFAGSQMKLFVRTPEGAVVQARLFAARTGSDQLVGRQVTLCWNADDVVLLDGRLPT